MISDRQTKILSKIPRHAGKTRIDYRELERMLNYYTYSDQELSIIEKGLDEFEAQQQAKKIAKQKLKEKLALERKANMRGYQK